MATLESVCKGAKVTDYGEISQVIAEYRRLYYNRGTQEWINILSKANNLPKDKVFYYAAIYGLTDIILEVVCSGKIYSRKIPPMSEWPEDLFLGVSDVRVNEVLIVLDKLGYNGGNNLGRYMRGRGECSGCAELRKEVKILSEKIRETELWDTLTNIDEDSTATKFMSEVETTLVDNIYVDGEIIKHLIAKAANENKQRLVHALFLLQ